MKWYQAVGLTECISAAHIVRISVEVVIWDFRENSMRQFILL